jgi:hypothetical protein
LHKATADKGEENIPKPTFRPFLVKRSFPLPQEPSPFAGTECFIYSGNKKSRPFFQRTAASTIQIQISESLMICW